MVPKTITYVVGAGKTPDHSLHSLSLQAQMHQETSLVNVNYSWVPGPDTSPTFFRLAPDVSWVFLSSTLMGNSVFSLGSLSSAGQVYLPETSFCVALHSTYPASPVGPNSANWTMPLVLSDRPRLSQSPRRIQRKGLSPQPRTYGLRKESSGREKGKQLLFLSLSFSPNSQTFSKPQIWPGTSLQTN